MDGGAFKLIEFALLAAGVFGVLFWQLRSVDRDIKARESEQSQDGSEPPKATSENDAASETAKGT